eukprot:scaffold19_cov114-Cylindrotheca_fusiformis.AAC.51
MDHDVAHLVEKVALLPIDFVPSKYDVIVGTGREARHHIGNKTFQNIVKRYLGDYANRPSKVEKGRIISDIINESRKCNPADTSFVKKVEGRWYALNNETIRERVSQSLRNELHSKYRSSKQAKKQRRIQICQEFDNAVRSMIRQPGCFIARRIERVSSDVARSKKGKVSDDEVCALFTEANIDILEDLKRLSLASITD